MRFFAVIYAAAALAAAFVRPGHSLAWSAVCFSAAALALASALGRPLVMPAAAHAGLTATWAGTLASTVFRNAHASAFDPVAVGVLIGLCGGMAVLIGSGLKPKPQPVPVPVRRR